MPRIASRFLCHVRELWPPSGEPGWRGRLGNWRWLWPALPFLAWALFCFAIGQRRLDHLVIVPVLPALAWTSRRTRKLFTGLLPLALVGVVYDAMQFLKNVGLSPDRIHTCDLEAIDARLFLGPGNQSWPAWSLVHGNLALDVFFAIPYAAFVYVTVFYAFWLYRADFAAMRRFTWAFFAVNVLGFLTYHVYPAAPPWYVHSRGCVADLAAHADAGVHLTRVDAWLGFNYFARFYSHSNDVYGAMPSLHVAYPLMVVLAGWRIHGWLGRSLAVGFWLWMSLAAIYLDHHWVADVLAGYAVTILGWLPVCWALAPHPLHPPVGTLQLRSGQSAA